MPQRRGDYTYNVYNGKALILGYKGAGGDVTIPATLGGYTVSSIGNSAFYRYTSLASIVIPDSVTSIGNAAFSYCSSLAAITIPDSVTRIGEKAFSGCNALDSIYIFNPSCIIDDNADIPTATTIYGFADSTAEAYATAKGNTFVAIEVSGITVSTLPTKTSYVIGEGLDTTGLVVTATYSTGHSGTVTAEVSMPDMTTAGTKTVTVTYADKTATFDITVNASQTLAGNVDGDGSITTSDARLILLYSIGATAAIAEEYLETADYNGDGGIDTSDAQLVLLAAIG